MATLTMDSMGGAIRRASRQIGLTFQAGLDAQTTTAVETVVEAEAQANPIIALAGKYNDAPWWDEYLAAIEEYRQEVNQSDPLG